MTNITRFNYRVNLVVYLLLDLCGFDNSFKFSNERNSVLRMKTSCKKSKNKRKYYNMLYLLMYFTQIFIQKLSNNGIRFDVIMFCKHSKKEKN